MLLRIILSLIFSRLFIVYLYFFSNRFYGIFDTKFRPIVGFFLMPLTLLWYSAVENWYYGEWGFWQITGIIAAILIDISLLGGSSQGSNNGESTDDSEEEAEDDD